MILRCVVRVQVMLLSSPLRLLPSFTLEFPAPRPPTHCPPDDCRPRRSSIRRLRTPDPDNHSIPSAAMVPAAYNLLSRSRTSLKRWRGLYGLGSCRRSRMGPHDVLGGAPDVSASTPTVSAVVILVHLSVYVASPSNTIPYISISLRRPMLAPRRAQGGSNFHEPPRSRTAAAPALEAIGGDDRGAQRCPQPLSARSLDTLGTLLHRSRLGWSGNSCQLASAPERAVSPWDLTCAVHYGTSSPKVLLFSS